MVHGVITAPSRGDKPFYWFRGTQHQFETPKDSTAEGADAVLIGSLLNPNVVEGSWVLRYLPPQPPVYFLRFFFGRQTAGLRRRFFFCWQNGRSAASIFFCWQNVKKNTAWLRKSQLTPLEALRD
jgi:hypothetical protein